MKKVTINLYEFNELNEKAKTRAIEEHRNFELSEMRPENFISGESEYDTPDKLQSAFDSEYKHYE